jgi:phosphoribosylanthranilate isomerase
MKVVRLVDRTSLATLRRYRCQAFLLEPAAGVAFDWAIAREAKGVARLVIGGGFTAETVGAAITAARPFGVDVCAGVESALGVKDPERMRRFVLAAREAAARG